MTGPTSSKSTVAESVAHAAYVIRDKTIAEVSVSKASTILTCMSAGKVSMTLRNSLVAVWAFPSMVKYTRTCFSRVV